MTAPVRVVVVEDSQVQRAHLVQTLEAEGDISVVGEAVGATEAIATIEREQPDVVTLDLVIPDGGGQHVIEQVMGRTPTAILVVSGMVHGRDSASGLDALGAGAVDTFPKPQHWTPEAEAEVRRRVRALRGVTVVRHPRGHLKPSVLHPTSATLAADRSGSHRQVVAIAASTGGPAALAKVLSGLHGLRASVLVVQHLHAEFVGGLVDWMTQVSPLPVRLARANEHLEPGAVYIGPGDLHLKLGPGHRIVLTPEPVTLHRPSANELFRSVADHAGADGIGVVLTGMGSDGAAGMLALREAGGMTIAQDEATSAVFGMPGAAVHNGAVVKVVPLDQIAGAILGAERRAPR
jgi:two-component system chemotaxis response regulator CheB